MWSCHSASWTQCFCVTIDYAQRIEGINNVQRQNKYFFSYKVWVADWTQDISKEADDSRYERVSCRSPAVSYPVLLGSVLSVTSYNGFFFYILLTVHLSIILVTDQLNAQILAL